MIDRINETLAFQMQALQLRAERQKVLAANIANADTPHFRAVDFDFAAALRAATGGARGSVAGSGSGAPVRTHAQHLPGAAGGTHPADLLYRTPAQPAIDNNTVDLDLERAQFAENAVRYEATLRFINGQIRSLLTAIRGESQGA